jgi:hypothetical protein
MSTVTGISALGDQFEFATVSSPATYTTLNGVTSVSFSGDKTVMEKTTQLGSAGGADTFLATTTDFGTVDIKGFFQPGDTTQVALEAIRIAGAAVNMKVLYGSSNSTSFTGLVESFTRNPAPSPEKLATFDVKVKISGAWTLA